MKKYLFTGMALLLAITQNYSQCACCAGAGIGSSNGDFTNGILTLPKNKWVVETYSDYRTINGGTPAVAAKADEEEALLNSMWIQSAGVRFGLTENITLSALLPYVFLHTDTGNDSGLGDVILLSTFTLYSKNNFSVGMQAGVELPTGIQKNGTFDNETVVVGSGSYDPMGGFVLSKRWNKLVLQANGLYKHTTSGFQGNYYGSIAIQQVALGYTILGASTSCVAMPTDEKGDNTLKDASNKTIETKRTLSWGIQTGYYGEWLDKIKEDGILDNNSGYYLGFATLGTIFTYNQWSFPINVSLPVIQDMNGNQNNGGFRIRFGIIKAF